MRPLYHEINSSLEIFTKRNATLPPHLHKYLECIYVTEGIFRLGIEKEWIDLKPHDFAIIFPNMIHEFEADAHTPSQAVYVLGTPDLAGSFSETLQKCYPRTPVIQSELVHPDIPYALNTLLCSEWDSCYAELQQAYFQVILARTLPVCELIEKEAPKSPDLTWHIVSYLSEHFMENISLTDLARKLYVNPCALSRIFSGIFHTNFNQYLNEIRLDHASHLLRTTDKPITDIFMDSGFTSQTTFNRAFKAKYNMPPRAYRNQNLYTKKQDFQQYSTSLQPKKEDTGSCASSSYPLVTGRFL